MAAEKFETCSKLHHSQTDGVQLSSPRWFETCSKLHHSQTPNFMREAKKPSLAYSPEQVCSLYSE